MWKTVKLGDVVSYDKINGQGSNLPYVGMENISSDTMKLVGKIDVPNSTSSTFIFNNEHLLYGRLRPYLRKVFAPDFKGQCSTEIFCLKPSPQLSRKFLAYWLLSPKVSADIENTSTGARMPRANMTAILDISFPLPPLAEQHRIVVKLDAAFAEIDKAVALAETKEAEINILKSAFLTSSLNNDSAIKTVKLGEVCDLQNGFAFKSALFRESGEPILRISNIQQEKVNTKNLVYFSNDDYSVDFARFQVKPDDLLIAMSGATTGKLGFNRTDEVFYLNQRVGKFEPHSKLDKKFLYYLLSTKVEENLSISKGAAQPNLSTQQIKDIDILLPPLAKQKRIVTKLDAAFAKLDTVKASIIKSKNNCKALKSSILKKELQTEATP